MLDKIYLIIYQKMECDFYRKKMSFLIEGLSMYLEHVCIIRYEEVFFFKEMHVLNAVPLMQRILYYIYMSCDFSWCFLRNTSCVTISQPLTSKTSTCSLNTTACFS